MERSKRLAAALLLASAMLQNLVAKVGRDLFGPMLLTVLVPRNHLAV
jgi:hypothetical protein